MIKYLIACAVGVLYVTSVCAQVPQGFSFQGVIYNSNQAPVTDTEVSVRVEITNDVSGAAQYAEDHVLTTGAAGLYSLVVGQGDAFIGDFLQVDWASIPKFIRVSVDVDGSGTFSMMTAQELMSVPYALVAGESQEKTKVFLDSAVDDYPWLLVPWLQGTGRDQTPLLNMSYEYISGPLEDLIVEFTDIPEGICISTTGFRGSNGNYVIAGGLMEGFTTMDTIKHGIYFPSFGAEVCDPSSVLQTGRYELPIEVRSGTEVLATSSYQLDFYRYAYERCLNDRILPITQVALPDTCSSDYLDSLLIGDITYLDTGTGIEIDLPTDLLDGTWDTSSCGWYQSDRHSITIDGAEWDLTIFGFGNFSGSSIHADLYNRETGEDISCVYQYE